MTDNTDNNLDELITLHVASQYAGLHHDTLRIYANNKRLKAQKSGGVWLTTRRWVNDYMQSRNPSGAPSLIERKAKNQD